MFRLLILAALLILPLHAQFNTSFENMHHSKVQSLLKSAVKNAHLNAEQQSHVEGIVREIELLGDALFEQEHKLKALKTVRKAEKGKFGMMWWLDAKHRMKVLEMDLKVKDQQRIVENAKEDLDIHWIKLKPYFGVFSEVGISLKKL
jgi:hypothetical protein